MGRNKSLGLVAATVVTGAVVLAACSSRPTTNKSDDDSKTIAPLPNTAWTKASYDDVKQGGNVVQNVARPFNFNQLQADDGLGSTYTLEYPMTLGAVRFKADGSWENDPNTAESVKLVSKDPQKIEVKLDPKAVWSDGKPITWQDMVDTWKALNGTNPKLQIITDNGFKDISSIDKGDDEYSYTITYKKVNADWPNYMYPIGPSLLTSTPEPSTRPSRRRCTRATAPSWSAASTPTPAW